MYLVPLTKFQIVTEHPVLLVEATQAPAMALRLLAFVILVTITLVDHGKNLVQTLAIAVLKTLTVLYQANPAYFQALKPILETRLLIKHEFLALQKVL